MKNRILPIYELDLPEYHVETEPDHEKIGRKVDSFIKRHFNGQHVAVRCISSSEHPNKSLDEVIDVIKETGWDRYDSNRKGDRYENNEGKEIDFFAFDYHIKKDTKIFSTFTWPNYHLDWREPYRPLRVDIIIFYDPTKLEQVYFTYKGREDEGERSDGWVFKDPKNKPDALKGIIKIL